MRPRPALDEDAFLRLGAGIVAGVLLLAAFLAAGMAQAHMVALGAICGASLHPHCSWCFGAAGLVLAGLAAIAYAVRPAAPPAIARAAR